MAQIVSWGSLYYAFALLLQALQQRLGGASASTVVGAFSLALLVAGLLAALLFGMAVRAQECAHERARSADAGTAR